MTDYFWKYVKDYRLNRIPSAEDKAKEFVLAATGGVYPAHKPDEKTDWEHLAFVWRLGMSLLQRKSEKT
jgi:hypothetical protein